MVLRSLVVAGLALLATPSWAAIAITEGDALSAADRTQLTSAEQAFFAELAAEGAVARFTRLLGGTPDPATAGNIALLETGCGKALGAQRVKTVSLGSLYARDTLLANHSKCVVRWELTFAKEDGSWQLKHVNFNTPQDSW